MKVLVKSKGRFSRRWAGSKRRCIFIPEGGILQKNSPQFFRTNLTILSATALTYRSRCRPAVQVAWIHDGPISPGYRKLVAKVKRKDADNAGEFTGEQSRRAGCLPVRPRNEILDGDELCIVGARSDVLKYWQVIQRGLISDMVLQSTSIE